jgi:hypothetical protein
VTDQPIRVPTTFLVERYLPPSVAAGLAASVARLASVCRRSDRDGMAVRYLRSFYLPTDDTCFCLFHAASADAVRMANDAAAFPIDRITATVTLFDPTANPQEFP